jgi:hypothetical protein
LCRCMRGMFGGVQPPSMNSRKVRKMFNTWGKSSRRFLVPCAARTPAAPGPRLAFFQSSGPQRLFAILILSIIGIVQAQPLFQLNSSDPESRLPACCRRHGAHHCAMADEIVKMTSSGRAQMGAVPHHCPMYPHVTTARVLRSNAELPPAAVFFADVVSHPTIHPQVNALGRLSLDRSRQKRGPPSLSIL